MIPRSECRCDCHNGNAIHITACCYPDDINDRIREACVHDKNHITKLSEN